MESRERGKPEGRVGEGKKEDRKREIKKRKEERVIGSHVGYILVSYL